MLYRGKAAKRIFKRILKNKEICSSLALYRPEILAYSYIQHVSRQPGNVAIRGETLGNMEVVCCAILYLCQTYKYIARVFKIIKLTGIDKL